MFLTEFGNVGEIFGHYSFRYFFCPILSSRPFWNSVYTLGVVPLVTETLCVYLFLSFFPPCSCVWIMSVTCLQVCWSFPLQNPLVSSKMCFMSGTVFLGPRIYTWLTFIGPISLLRFSTCLFILSLIS